MRITNYLLVALTAILLSACSGSDTYRGKWKATDADGLKFDLTFEAKKFSIRTDDGETTDFGYSQNSINIENSVSTYGISLDDGRSFQISFPLTDDETKGVFLDANGNFIYAISRDSYISYDDIFGL